MKTLENELLHYVMPKKSKRGEVFFAIILRFRYKKKPLARFRDEFDLDPKLMDSLENAFRGKKTLSTHAEIFAECLVLPIFVLFDEIE
jgi:hypothetical protein